MDAQQRVALPFHTDAQQQPPQNEKSAQCVSLPFNTDAQQRVPTADYFGEAFPSHQALHPSPLKNTAPACYSQTGAAIKQTN